MSSFSLVLRKGIAFLFIAFGLVAGACCLYGFVLCSWRWHRTGELDESDHGLWTASLAFGLVCLGIFAAGLMLRRPAPAQGEGVFTKAAGPRRRHAASSSVINTIMWPPLSANH